MYQKALVPLDGSALAECALGHVQNLVKVGAGSIYLDFRVLHHYIA